MADKPEDKGAWIRARCSPVLKQRLTDYLATLAARGNSKKESELLRDLLVKFLDEAYPVPATLSLNEPSDKYPKSNSSGGKIRQIVERVDYSVKRVSKKRGHGHGSRAQ